MKIRVTAIPEEGLLLELDQATKWFQALLRERFSEIHPGGAPASGRIELQKTLQNVALSGDLRIALHPSCASCGKAFDSQLEVPLLRNLAPYFSGPREGLLSEEEEIELSAEDLEFSFYHNDEIDLGEFVSEEITLALPIRFLCKEDCRGLCPRCGADRNEGSCACAEEVEGSPFAVLKGLKLKS